MKKNTNMNMTAKRETEFKKALMLPKEKVRSLNITSLKRGSSVLSSTSMKTGKNMAASASSPTTAGEVQPLMPPCVRASKSPKRPTRKVRLPKRSSFWPFLRFTNSLRFTAAQTVPTRPSGTLNQKTHSQEMEVITPPT